MCGSKTATCLYQSELRKALRLSLHVQSDESDRIFQQARNDENDVAVSFGKDHPPVGTFPSPPSTPPLSLSGEVKLFFLNFLFISCRQRAYATFESSGIRTSVRCEQRKFEEGHLKVSLGARRSRERTSGQTFP